ncbi:YifB family Mg chelatase-like AAA ATPase [Paenibacillus sp. LHD-117]|uniref:YifB family Mg chelatase-like AAA ATPase n=1 Tax=Paenibacillus sp. LHD-117 TaxID=3071412 RepID=UPI0027DF4834|nr:YifB family Mg chelatase-like AAA ATPase [Paenibacillus sp. LHD-117]MDQ6419273.1 YifB family Mg chelatase-like AAA ATPase [Paenibacillus sp. LHD-117]
MFTMIHSSSVFGVEGKGISVEVDLCNGLPQVNVVGLPDPAVRESVERVRAAIKNSGFQFPMERITVNLAPADLRKEGTAFDLAIAAGILTASGQLDGNPFSGTLLIGELSLNGAVRPVTGVLAMLEEAKRCGIRRVLLPHPNRAEAEWISGMELFAISHLKELRDPSDADSAWDRLRGVRIGDGSLDENLRRREHAEEAEDYADIVGQHQGKRAMLIAAAGKHNILLSGPPGTGKTMMIRRLPGILPQLSEREALEVTKIYSVAGKLHEDARGLMVHPPFRAPHHSISTGGLIGGGSVPKPGEVTLAHRGVLYLDELPEFPRSVLELLRQPLEDRVVSIARARATVHFPASILLAASYNPCPCGYYGHEYGEKRCTCSAAAVSRYRSKLSGPLLDRIDLQLEIPRPLSLNRSHDRADATTADLRQQVLEARSRQHERNAPYGVLCNSELSGRSLREAAKLRPSAGKLLEDAFLALGISMRAYDRLLKLARTIADVEGSDGVEEEHVAEAIQYRRLDMQQS